MQILGCPIIFVVVPGHVISMLLLYCFCFIAVEIPETDGPAPVDEGSNAVTLPNEADFLLGYATMPGYVSYRSRSSGSWYISKLAEVLQKHASRYVKKCHDYYQGMTFDLELGILISVTFSSAGTWPKK